MSNWHHFRWFCSCHRTFWYNCCTHIMRCKSCCRMLLSHSFCFLHSDWQMFECILRSICNFVNRLTTTKNVCLLTLYLEIISKEYSIVCLFFLRFGKLHRNTTTTTEKQITTDRLIIRSAFRACISCHSINSCRFFTNLKVISFSL